MEFEGRTVLITGAAGNLGRAVGGAFGALGANLVLVDRRREDLDVHGSAGPRCLLAAADLLSLGEVQAAVDSALGRFGRVDVLCNIAGGFRMGEPVHECPDETFDFLFNINAKSLLHSVRAVVPQMISNGGGKVVNIGAFGAQKGAAYMGAYSASKSAVIRLTEAMAAELRDKGINVNCVLPTIIDTPENRSAMPDADPARWVSTHDLAQVIVFLASDGARALHGASLPVTGLSG